MDNYEIYLLIENANISTGLDLPCFKITCNTDTFFILSEVCCLRTEAPTLWRKHDGGVKWKHFPRYWPFCGEFTGPGEIPSQRPVTRSFDVFFDQRMHKRLRLVILDAFVVIMTSL